MTDGWRNKAKVKNEGMRTEGRSENIQQPENIQPPNAKPASDTGAILVT